MHKPHCWLFHNAFQISMNSFVHTMLRICIRNVLMIFVFFFTRIDMMLISCFDLSLFQCQ